MRASKAQFVDQERTRQGAFFGRSAAADALHPEADYRLTPDRFFLNLAPSIQEGARDYFDRYLITWRQHASRRGDPWADDLTDRYTYLTPAPGASDARE